MSKMFDEVGERRQARYRARFLSWKYGREIIQPSGNLDGFNSHWIHMPLRWADTGEPVSVAATPDAHSTEGRDG